MGCRFFLCIGLAACTGAKIKTGSHAAAHITLSLSVPTLSAGQQATLTWHSDVAGNYLVTTSTDTAPAMVLSRGQVAANAVVATVTDAGALYDGVNHLTVAVLVEEAPVGHGSIDLTVSGGGAGSSSGGSSGGSSTGGNDVYTVSGTVSGITTAPLTPMLLTNNGGDPISIGQNGGFSFPTALAPGAAYAVALAKSPLCPLYTCAVSGGAGNANADVTDVAVTCAATGLGVPPRIFFTDIISGPNAGGDGGNGAYVTLYGLDFGSAAGTVSIGGQPVIIKHWGNTGTTARGLETVVIQLGPQVVSATPPVDQPLVLTTAAGIQSNTVDFGVSGTGNIYFVKGGAATDGDGASSATPFDNIAAARAKTNVGDIVYLSGQFNTLDVSASDCYSSTNNDQQGLLCLADAAKTSGFSNAGDTPSGIDGFPIAYIGLPGSPATFTNSSNTTGDLVIMADHIVLAGLIVSSVDTDGSSISNSINSQGNGNRIVGNILSNGGGLNIQFASTHTRVLGNVSSGSTFGGSYTFGVHGDWSQDSVDTEIGWNDIRNDNINAIQLTTGGEPSDAVVTTSIHDNWLQPNNGYGAGVATSLYDPANAGFYGLQIYNNVISDGASCVFLDNANCAASNPSDCIVHVWGNTCGYNPADANTSQPQYSLLSAGSLNGQWLDFDSNMFFLLSSTAETSTNPFVDSVPLPNTSGTNRVGGQLHPFAVLPGDATFAGNFYGSTSSMSGPGWDLSAKTGNPIFHNALSDDYSLAAFSTAVDAGAVIPVATDYRGVPRGQGKGYDIGAFEYCPGLDH